MKIFTLSYFISPNKNQICPSIVHCPIVGPLNLHQHQHVSINQNSKSIVDPKKHYKQTSLKREKRAPTVLSIKEKINNLIKTYNITRKRFNLVYHNINYIIIIINVLNITNFYSRKFVNLYISPRFQIQHILS